MSAHPRTNEDSRAGSLQSLASLGLAINSTSRGIRAPHRHNIHHGNGDNKREVNGLEDAEVVSRLSDDAKHHDYDKRNHQARQQGNQPVVSADGDNEERKKKA